MESKQVSIDANYYFNDVYGNTDDFLILLGGAGSGKSYVIAQKILLRVITEQNHTFLCTRKVGATIKHSIFALFKEVISRLDLYDAFRFNHTEKTITYLPNKNKIICKGLDDPEKMKSIAGITGIWIEEATEVAKKDFDQLDIRLRGETSNYKQIILSFNPVDETHWIKNAFVDETNWLQHRTYTLIHTTYKDNAFIDADYKAKLESRSMSEPNFYRIYALGEWGKPDIKNAYMYNFNKDKHVVNKVAIDENYPLILSFDFNVNPFVCIVGQVVGLSQQMPNPQTNKPRDIRFIREIVLNTGDIFKMCEVIKQTLTPIQLSRIMITGDATSRKKQIGVRENIDAWKQIQRELNVNNLRMRVPLANPSVKDNRVHCNYVLHFDNVQFDSSMKTTINDMMYVETDEQGNIIKDRTTQIKRADALDCIRYFFNTFVKR